eukprot:TRINITY_DN12832_c0_g1_i1.p1 TRINITY_DN12832_c0_g1~~TRINITY_DN12832_c0_g1_i1.p1  ORF type:complete len:121 (+),score=12.11 TRINITY_DN12832_c0_g1_i1:89-451(+)
MMSGLKKDKITPIAHPNPNGDPVFPDDLLSPTMGVPRMTSVTAYAGPKEDDKELVDTTSPLSPAPGVKRMTSVTAAVAGSDGDMSEPANSPEPGLPRMASVTAAAAPLSPDTLGKPQLEV